MRACRLALFVGLLLGASACAPTGASTAFLLENATDVPVQILVDGSWVGTYEAGTSRDVPAPGAPPHRVEVLSVSGARLLEWGYDANQATAGAVTSVDVPCGVVRLSVGRIELPALPPAEAVPTGPCP